MYRNLKAEIVRAGMTNPEMADAIGMKHGKLWRLLSGKQQFRLGEMMSIQAELEERNGESYTLDYLFLEGSDYGEVKTDSGAHASSVRPD